MEIVYCDRCGIRVPDKDIEEGRALRGPEGVVCAQCNKIKIVKPAGVSRSSGAHLLPSGNKTERRSEVGVKVQQRPSGIALPAQATSRPSAPIPKPQSTPNNAVITMSVVGAAIILVGLALALRSDEKPVASKPPPEAAPPLPVPAVVVPPARPVTRTANQPERKTPETSGTANAPSNTPELTEAEKKEQSDYDTLMHFEGLAANDVAGKLARIQEFLDKHSGSMLAARARVAADELKSGAATPANQPAPGTPPSSPAPDDLGLEGPITVFKTDYVATPPIIMKDCRFIWSAEPTANSTRYFRTTIDLTNKPAFSRANVLVTCDDTFKMYYNGRLVACTPKGGGWAQYQWVGLLKVIKPGKITLAFECANYGGPAGLLARFYLEYANGTNEHFDTNETWKTASQAEAGWYKPGFDDSAWQPATVVGTFGERWKEEAQYPNYLTYMVEPKPGTPADPTPVTAATAKFLKADSSTKGKWQGVYGQSGYFLSALNCTAGGETPLADNDAAKLPDYVESVLHDGGKVYGWLKVDDRALKPPAGEARGVFANFETQFGYKIRFKNAHPCRLSVYCVDMSPAMVSQSVALIDTATGQVLDTQKIEKFDQGVYLSWTVRAPEVRLAFTSLVDKVNAVCNGIFFDEAPADGELAVAPDSKKTPDDPGKKVEPKNDLNEQVLQEIEGHVKALRWKEAYERAELLIEKPDEKLTPDQRTRAEALRQKSETEYVNTTLRTDRFKIAGVKRQAPDGRWEFFYDFSSSAQRVDFYGLPNEFAGLDKGEVQLSGAPLTHMLSFAGDLDISYEVMPIGTQYGRVVLGFYDIRGELGCNGNVWSGMWRDVPFGYDNPLAKSESIKANLNHWQRIEYAFDAKTKTTTVQFDGKDGFKFTYPETAGKGTVFLYSFLTAKYRNFRIKGYPTAKSLERAERFRKVAADMSRKLASGKPVPLFSKEEVEFSEPRWQTVQDEVMGSGSLFVPGLATCNYELTFEAKRVDGKEFQMYLRRNTTHSWHLSMNDLGVCARIWDHAASAEAKNLKTLATDVSKFHKFQVRSYAKTLQVTMDDKDVLIDLKDVPLDALGFFITSFEAKGSLRKTMFRLLP